MFGVHRSIEHIIDDINPNGASKASAETKLDILEVPECNFMSLNGLEEREW